MPVHELRRGLHDGRRPRCRAVVFVVESESAEVCALRRPTTPSTILCRHAHGRTR